jgi:hypothetical protein
MESIVHLYLIAKTVVLTKDGLTTNVLQLIKKAIIITQLMPQEVSQVKKQ